jgi:hypothetical protein
MPDGDVMLVRFAAISTARSVTSAGIFVTVSAACELSAVRR